MNASQTPKQKRASLPRICLCFYVLAAMSTLFYLLFRFNEPFADWFNQTVSAWIRRALAALTSWIPFSVAELFILLLPAVLIFLIVIAAKKYSASWREALTFVGILFSVVALVWTIFVWSFAAGYSAPSLDKKLELEREKISAQELYDTAEVLRREIDALSKEIIFLEDGASLMPYSYGEMNEHLMEAYERFAKENPQILKQYASSVKPVMLSKPMSYTHITGVYTFFTGEANVNVNFPDYTVPYTAAHELAHQRGIAREDEANFIAFLVCRESDDPYIRYSGYLNVYEYVASALYSTDPALYSKSYQELPEGVKAEELAYSAFFDQYRDNVVADLSEATNNGYLILQGNPEGTRSYHLVVDLTVAFYKSMGLLPS